MPTRLPSELAVYDRAGHAFGVRNHIVVVPATFCQNRLADDIEREFEGTVFGVHGENRVIALQHAVGCCGVGFDERLGLQILRNALQNPNIGQIVVLSLGCGQYCTSCKSVNGQREAQGEGKLIMGISGSGAPVQFVGQVSGSDDVHGRACHRIEALIEGLERQKRELRPVSQLAVGVMNGASDPTSGLWANPAVGEISDALVAAGGKVLASQTVEMLGAERLVLSRPALGTSQRRLKNLLQALGEMRAAAIAEGAESEPTPGNRRNGLSSLAEKSCGTVLKMGASPVTSLAGVVAHRERVKPRHDGGLYVVDGPGQDVICMTGLTAAGAQAVLFTTGLGTPTGSPFAPTIKITANKETYDTQRSDIDIYLPVEQVIDGHANFGDMAADAIIPVLVDVLEGRQLTAAERHGQRDFQVRQLWPVD